jgi:hypothetical protein
VSFEVVPPICEMGLVVLITVASLGCIFMLIVLVCWVQDAKGKSRTRKTASERPRMQPFLVEKENGDQTRDAATTRPTGTDGLRLSKKSPAQSAVSDSEILVRRRIVQVFATRMASRREE